MCSCCSEMMSNVACCLPSLCFWLFGWPLVWTLGGNCRTRSFLCCLLWVIQYLLGRRLSGKSRLALFGNKLSVRSGGSRSGQVLHSLLLSRPSPCNVRIYFVPPRFALWRFGLCPSLFRSGSVAMVYAPGYTSELNLFRNTIHK